jgi:hypothetical protein
MKLGAWGWLLSVALVYALGGLLVATGVIVSALYTGSAMATTAIGTLIPILRDNNELKTRFGTFLLAAGGAGEFGPILLVTLVLSTQSALHESVILLAFVGLALRGARRGGPGRGLPSTRRRARRPAPTGSVGRRAPATCGSTSASCKRSPWPCRPGPSP